MILPNLAPLGPALPFVYAAIILAVTWALARAVNRLIRSVMSESMPHVAVSSSRFTSVLIWVVGIVLAVQEIGVSTDILLLVVGLAGVAAVIACREALENAGAKYFSDVYIPFKIGDSVRVGEHEGKVIEINPMTTLLLTEKDQLVSIPNRMFMGQVVVNTTPQAWKEVAIPISVTSGINLAEFESEVRKSLSKLRSRLDPRFPPLLSGRARNPLTSDLTLTLFIRQPGDRDIVTTEANRRVSLVLEKLQRPKRNARNGRAEPAT